MPPFKSYHSETKCDNADDDGDDADDDDEVMIPMCRPCFADDTKKASRSS